MYKNVLINSQKSIKKTFTNNLINIVKIHFHYTGNISLNKINKELNLNYSNLKYNYISKQGCAENENTKITLCKNHKYQINSNKITGLYKKNFTNLSKGEKYQSDTNAVRLNYSLVEANSENTNKNIVFLHGLFGNSNNWRSISYSSAIRDRRKSLLVDLRNHGDSDHNEEMSYSAMAHDVLRLLDHLKIDKCTLLGHSMGGKVAMNFATLFPSRLDGLIIVDSAPKDHKDNVNIYGGTKKIVEDVSELNVEGRSRKDVLNELKTQFNGSVANLLNTNLTYISPEDDKVTWRCNMKAIRKNIDNIIGFQSAPGKVYEGNVSVIVGEKSHIFPLDVYKTIFPRIEEQDVKKVKEAGHWVHVDNPTGVIVNIIKFLDQIDKKSR